MPAAPHKGRKQHHNTAHTHTHITRTHGHPWTRYHVVGIQLCSFAYLEVASKPKSTKTEALAGMAVGVLTLLTLIITGSAVLLAQGRRDA